MRQQLQINNSWYTNQRKHTRDDGEKLKGCLSRGLQDQDTQTERWQAVGVEDVRNIGGGGAEAALPGVCGGCKSVGADSQPKKKTGGLMVRSGGSGVQKAAPRFLK